MVPSSPFVRFAKSPRSQARTTAPTMASTCIPAGAHRWAYSITSSARTS